MLGQFNNVELIAIDKHNRLHQSRSAFFLTCFPWLVLHNLANVLRSHTVVERLIEKLWRNMIEISRNDLLRSLGHPIGHTVRTSFALGRLTDPIKLV
jgi:hypothetical protein